MCKEHANSNNKKKKQKKRKLLWEAYCRGVKQKKYKKNKVMSVEHDFGVIFKL